MSPSKPQDPDKGKAAEAEQVEREAEQAKQTKAKAKTKESPAEGAGARRRSRARRADATEQETEGAQAPAKRPRRRRVAAAEGTAAEQTETEKEGAAAATSAAGAEAPGRPAAAVAGTRRPARPGSAVLVRARARYVRSSARKARLVGVHLRGKRVPEARAMLAFAPRAVARDWAKLLDSAVANAENNHELVGDELRVREAYADEGPTLKRYRPRAMGRATPIHKRTSHLTITLTPQE